MARRIPVGITTVQELASRVEYELDKLSYEAKRGLISKSKLANPDSSYLFEDDGVLKYFNSVTGETKTVSLS